MKYYVLHEMLIRNISEHFYLAFRERVYEDFK